MNIKIDINKLKVILPLIGISLSIYVGFCKKKQTSEITYLKPLEFKKTVEQLYDPQLIDVNTFDEFSKHHIKGAWNMDFHSSDFDYNLEKLLTNEPVFVYCNIGGRSKETSEKLKEKGYLQIFVLKGGLAEWLKSGLPVDEN